VPSGSGAGGNSYIQQAMFDSNGNPYALLELCAAGTTSQSWLSPAATRYQDLYQYFDDVIIELGNNDSVSTDQGAANYAAIFDFVASQGKRIIKLALQPRGGTVTETAGSFITSHPYTILTIGTTDYTLIGAASNTIGLTFVATGAGSGTGTARRSPTLDNYVAPYDQNPTSTPNFQINNAILDWNGNWQNIQYFCRFAAAGARQSADENTQEYIGSSVTGLALLDWTVIGGHPTADGHVAFAASLKTELQTIALGYS
jgi:hypothetical protein